ncbi:MAG: hypothetical protein SGJ20_12010 [Planctomycetota bacterium]|nr:hypothetical protein [Planctomycetota bacterium]
MNRHYRTSASAKPSRQVATDFFRTYGSLEGWQFKDNNLMVEGTTDVRYFEIANQIYVKESGHSLIDGSFGVLAIGEAEDGGTYGMKEKLNTLWRIRRLAGQDGREGMCRVIALLDDDSAGRDAFRHIEQRGARPWIDLFLLRRRNPRVDQPSSFKNQCDNLNHDYLQNKLFFCVIEDLIAFDVIDDFRRQHPNCLRHGIQECAGAFHVDLNREYKGKLVGFVQDNALLSDVIRLVELLQAFRCLLRLPVEGSPTNG